MTPAQAAAPRLAAQPILIPPGYGVFRAAPPEHGWGAAEEDDLLDRLLVWEGPRRRQKYVIGVDVSEGVGLDKSVIDVLRIGNLREVDEQVAQFASRKIDPQDLAYVIDTVGRFYADDERYEALVAIECNGFGLGTQSELIRHLGYGNLFVWQYEDAATPEGRWTRKYGWWTSVRTRPLIIGRYIKAVKTVDPVTQDPFYRINSPLTLTELQDFHVPPGHGAYDAVAAPGANDDCIMAGAISVHVAQTTHFEDFETLADWRARLNEERDRARKEGRATGVVERRNFHNTDASYGDMYPGEFGGDTLGDDDQPLHI